MIKFLILFLLPISLLAQDIQIKVTVPKGVKVVIDTVKDEPDPLPVPPDTPITTIKTLRIDDFKVEGDEDYLNAWIKVKKAIPEGDTGIIIFGEGIYNIKTAGESTEVGWWLEKSNITLQGAGIDKTVLTADSSIGVTMSNSTRLHPSFVRGYLAYDSAFAFTYFNTLRKGDRFIKLKDASYTDSIKAGAKMMLVGGGHYFDQEFGELVTITSKNEDTLFLKDPMSGAYAIDSVPYGNVLEVDFVMPKIGDTVSVTPFCRTTVGRFINVGDEIFIVKAASEALNTITLLNAGRGNSPEGTLITAGTHMMKARVILLWKHTQNLKIKDLTISGQQQRVLRLDNTYGGELINVKVTRGEHERGGYVYTADFSREISATNCEFTSLSGSAGSQISRSSGDISFKKSVFNRTKTDCSEYSFNIEFDSCTFNMVDPGYTFVLGTTVRKSKITNCIFNADSTNGIIQAAEIQSLTNIQREYSLIKGNIFNVMRYCSSIVDLSSFGNNWFVNNTIVGSGTLFNFSGSLNRFPSSVGLYPHNNYINDNSMIVRFSRAFCVGGLNSGTMSNNHVVNIGASRVPVFVAYTTNVKGALINNNTFENFVSPITAPAGVVLDNNQIK